MTKSKKQTAKSETKKTSKKAKSTDTVVSTTPVNQAGAPAVQLAQEQPVALPLAAAQKAPKAAKSAPAPKAPREERNGVRRPRESGKCAAVWTYLDANPMTTAKEMREVAVSKGWNVNNASIELSQWRKFMGMTKPKFAAK